METQKKMCLCALRTCSGIRSVNLQKIRREIPSVQVNGFMQCVSPEIPQL